MRILKLISWRLSSTAHNDSKQNSSWANQQHNPSKKLFSVIRSFRVIDRHKKICKKTVNRQLSPRQKQNLEDYKAKNVEDEHSTMDGGRVYCEETKKKPSSRNYYSHDNKSRFLTTIPRIIALIVLTFANSFSFDTRRGECDREEIYRISISRCAVSQQER